MKCNVEGLVLLVNRRSQASAIQKETGSVERDRPGPVLRTLVTEAFEAGMV